MCEYVEKKGGMSVVTSEVMSVEFAGKDTAQCQSGHDKFTGIATKLGVATRSSEVACAARTCGYFVCSGLMMAYKFFSANLNAGAILWCVNSAKIVYFCTRARFRMKWRTLEWCYLFQYEVIVLD